MYSLQTSLVLIAMIVTGASRSVAVKLVYQLGFENPFAITFLYFLGQTLSLVVHSLQNSALWLCNATRTNDTTTSTSHDAVYDNNDDDDHDSATDSSHSENAESDNGCNCSNGSSRNHRSRDVEQPCSSSNINGKLFIRNHQQQQKEAEEAESVNQRQQKRKNQEQDGPEQHNKIHIKRNDNFSNIGNDKPSCPAHYNDESNDDHIIVTIQKLNSDSMSDAGSSTSSTHGGNGMLNNSVSTSNHSTATTNPRTRPQRHGSLTGLTMESEIAIKWIHSIPWYWKPIIPGIFNLCNSIMRWASLLYVAASTAEMFISGLELILSVLVAKLVRKRQISRSRWLGVIIVIIGLAIIRIADNATSSTSRTTSNYEEFTIMDPTNSNNDTNAINDTITNQYNDHHHGRIIHIVSPHDGHNSSSDFDSDESYHLSSAFSSTNTKTRIIGDVLIIGQCIMSVFQDMAEELFMQESEFPATLLLGLEGFVGLLFGLPSYYIYLFFAGNIGEKGEEDDETSTSNVFFLGFDTIKNNDTENATAYANSTLLVIIVGLTCIFTVTGIFNIVATNVTSSMTRNVWKNFRTILVWIFGLCIYYFSTAASLSTHSSSTSTSDLGEPWIIPHSLIILFGFGVMLSGLRFYYKYE